MNRWLSLIVALAWLTVVLAEYYGVGGAWRIIPLVVAGIGHTIQLTEARRRKGDDEATTLKLSDASVSSRPSA